MTKFFSVTERQGPHSIGFTTFLLLLFITLFIVTPCPSMAADSKSGAAAQSDVQKARIEAELAAKKPLRLIIKDALDSGMTMGWVVDTLIKSGGAPSTVVYIAVSDGRDIPDAIKAALGTLCMGGKATNKLKAVIGGAMGAGAGKEVVIKIAMEAGCPSGEVADAVSAAETSGGPLYESGFSSAAPTSGKIMYVPPPPVIIGGGPGGATKPASPSKPR